MVKLGGGCCGAGGSGGSAKHRFAADNIKRVEIMTFVSIFIVTNPLSSIVVRSLKNGSIYKDIQKAGNCQ